MNVELYKRGRDGEVPRFHFRIDQGDRLLCDTGGTALVISSQEAARWLADLVIRLLEDGFSDSIATAPSDALWEGDLADDCTTYTLGFLGRAEWLDEEQWYCGVYRGDDVYFHTADHPDVVPSSGDAARWLVELMIAAASRGLLAAGGQ